MKRGKDDDKIMGPMFPRLHVNDTERGGPRAPPRNKMALYEQLTVPSQRYNTGAVPHHPSKNSSLNSSTSTNQGTGHERDMYIPLYRTPSGPSYDELPVRQPEAVSLSSGPTQVENTKKPIEEDDFMVPVFSQPGIGQCNSKTQNSIDGERQTHPSSNHPVPFLCSSEKQANKMSGDITSRRVVINRDQRNLRAYNASTRSSDILTREKDCGRRKDTSQYQEKRMLSNLEKTDACLYQDHEDRLLAVGTRFGETDSEPPLESTHKVMSLRLMHNPLKGCGYNDVDAVNIEMPRLEEHLLERENIDRANDVSETSMVDSVSGVEVCPDDVVGIIGRKHFWKARTAIVNQQRVFAVQVFELHRLLKVQKHIAGSPHVLLEGAAFVGKTTLKDSAAKKFSSEFGVKAFVHTIKQKDDSRKPTDKTEGTAENAVPKAAPHSQNAVQPAGYPPASSPPVNTDPKMNPWSYPQPQVHQWLVPVMTPSEGLVYKPYPAPPGMVGPGCGGYGPGGPTSVGGNMMNMGYGMPNPHFQGAVHFGGQGYFPPYPMPMMSPVMSGSAVDQMNQFSGGPNPFGQMNQPAAGSVNQTLQHQNSCNKPGQRRETAAPAAMAPLSRREGELQGSTGSSSPSKRGAQGTGTSPPTKERDALPLPLPLFPTAPVAEKSEGAPPVEKASRVIKVVPHNPKSTKESAARIFQSIQAERRQYESKSN
uniref:Early flowering 3 n=1 Tax=Mesembryanthemum crystallinum TaxID=3544 RepID=Q6UEI3_MESCR|nr:early flowering 3 [Mesembryanthemum crystallinum]